MRGARRASVPSPGELLAGKYRIEQLLGEGGMAFVFSAREEPRGRPVALKVLSPEFANDAELVARFAREAQAVHRLRSENVVRMYDISSTSSGLPFIVMELLEGRDLEVELAERGRLPVDEAVDYVLQACAAMSEAHAAGIVHRDLKPANLFVDWRSGEGVVKVLDFGISKVRGAARLTAAGAVMGTVLYISPEQLRASEDVDERTDIWSLGVILYELVSGRPPFDGTAQQVAEAILHSEVPDVRRAVALPEGVAAPIHAMLEGDPSGRVQNVHEVIRLLGPFARPGSPGARSTGLLSTRALSGQPITMRLAPGGGAGSTIPMGRLGVIRGAPAAPASEPSSTRDMVRRPPDSAPSPQSNVARRAAASDPKLERGAPLWMGVLIGLAVAALVVGSVAAFRRLRTKPASARHAAAASAAPPTSSANEAAEGASPSFEPAAR